MTPAGRKGRQGIDLNGTGLRAANRNLIDLFSIESFHRSTRCEFIEFSAADISCRKHIC